MLCVVVCCTDLLKLTVTSEPRGGTLQKRFAVFCPAW